MGLPLAPGTVVEEGRWWTLAVNRNQNLLGKLMLVCRREVTAVHELSEPEWAALRLEMARARRALDDLLVPTRSTSPSS